MKTVNDSNARGRSDAGGSRLSRPPATPHPPASEEGRPERVPCAGNGNGTSLNNAGSNGNYWSSVPNSDNDWNSWNLNFNSGNHDMNNNNRNNGQPVRPVSAFASAPQGGVPHRSLFDSNTEAQRHRGTEELLSLLEDSESRSLGEKSKKSLHLQNSKTPRSESNSNKLCVSVPRCLCVKNETAQLRQSLLADLIVAYRDARRHKRGRDYQTRFEMDQERELVKLRDELLERRYAARPCSCFIIHDPKMREVFAAEFRDRVVHHLFYNYTHGIFERTFIADSYSCIEGRGTHYGVERLKHHLLSCSQNWTKPCHVLKLDIKGYFMSINRARLLERCRKILNGSRKQSKAIDCNREQSKSPIAIEGNRMPSAAIVDYLLESICLLDPLENCRIIGDRREWEKLPPEKSLFHSRPGCGLPIGNLSSQLFSNVYLGALDDFMKRELKCRHYGRYVDDVYVVAPSKEELYGIVPKARAFLRDELDLELNEDKVRVVDAYKGVEFLGAYVKPYRAYPASRTLKRMRGKMKSLFPAESPRKAQARVNSMLGVLSHYDCWHVRKVLAWEAGLRKYGRVTDDCLRFYPDALGFRLRAKAFDSKRLLSKSSIAVESNRPQSNAFETMR